MQHKRPAIHPGGAIVSVAVQRAETIGYLILFAILSLHMLAALVQLAGGRFTAPLAAALLLAACASAHLLARLDGLRPAAAEWVAAILITSAALLLGGSVFDFTVDGNAYHFQAIDAYAHGWNRLHAILPDAPSELPSHIWSMTYPAGHWLVMAVPIATGLPDEAAKGIWIALAVALVLLGGAILSRLGISARFALPAAALSVANPIFLQQMATRLNDGIVSLLLFAFAALALSAVALRDRRALAGLVLVVILVLNTKFSLVPITVAFCGIACLLAYRTVGQARAVRLGGVLLAAGITGLLVVGFSPYVVNTAQHGHPFHPVMGPNKTDIMSFNTPERLAEIGYPLNFWASVLAVTDKQDVRLKPPFQVTRREIYLSGYPDPRIGGFGPLFSGILLLAVITAGACLLNRPLSRGQSVALAVALLLLPVGALFPEGWWARYVSFLWLVPVAIALAGAQSCARLPQLLAAVVLLVMAANSAMVFAAAGKRSYEQTMLIRQELARLKASPEPVRIDFGINQSLRAMVQRAGIPHQEVSFAKDGPCPGAIRLAGSINDLQGFRCPAEPAIDAAAKAPEPSSR